MSRRRPQTRREKTPPYDKPMLVYEMHMGSFLRHEEDNRYYSYSELADILPSYLKQLGYTHVEFLPLQEHPFDGSWGYQVCAFYAPTSRFGTPNEFRHLINSLHKAGIGVIMGRYRQVIFQGGRVGVTGVGENVNRIFNFSGLYKIVERFEREEDAFTRPAKESFA